MKGLLLTQIKSHGLNGNFNRYQLWEYDLIPQYNRKPYWYRGEIKYHCRTWEEASEYFDALAPYYEDVDFNIVGE